MDKQHTGYAVTDWDALFEVDSKGREWGTGQKFRAGPLRYIRFPVDGQFGRRIQIMERLAGPDFPHVIGVYISIVRLVAALERSLRVGGAIRWHTGEPATVGQIAELLNLPEEPINRALAVLADERVGLVRRIPPQTPPEQDQTKQDQTILDHTIPYHTRQELPDFPGNSGKSREIPGSERARALSPGLDAEFDRFWAAYPKKIGRKDALEAFARIAPDADLMERIMEAVGRWSTSGDWLRDGGRYIPRPAKWLESEGWQDVVPTQTGGLGHDCAKCRINGISGTGRHRHSGGEYGDYWLCDAHEAESRKAVTK